MENSFSTPLHKAFSLPLPFDASCNIRANVLILCSSEVVPWVCKGGFHAAGGEPESVAIGTFRLCSKC